jgi:hypothetical protein
LPKIELETNDDITDLGLADFGINIDDYNDNLIKSAEEKTEEMWKLPEIVEALNILKEIYTKMRDNYISYKKYEYIIAYLQQLRNKENRFVPPPSDKRIEQLKKETYDQDLEDVAAMNLIK